MSASFVDALSVCDRAGRIDVPITRWELACLFAARGYAQGAEIGVERGEFSEALMQANERLSLIAVDAWQAYPGYREHVTQSRLDGFYHETLLRLRPYGVSVRRGFSTEVARTVPDRSLGFVYIDANHVFEHVVADIAAWAPKVRSGGIVAGHDFGRSSVGQVKEAVEAWVASHGIERWFVLTGDRSPSWAWVAR